MKLTHKHPAIRLANWLKEMRQKHGFVKRVFASQLHFSPAQYTEVEAGVCCWIEKKNEDAIVKTLSLSGPLAKKFKEMLVEARKSNALTFSDLFTREQLTPIRARHNGCLSISDFEKQIILDAVFAPLS